ncbi:Toll-like receptor 7 [Holothuria leucospilota]|uniref:Toll-like receptor 7 n=1 Tax=Holothuria leucospilota TaxID=206669 RepID=A0A9Q0YE40_HOLLE|nr:Toll-like receptor 7 [Holothuria leucospilota]
MRQMIKLVFIFNYNLHRISGEMFSGVKEIYSIDFGYNQLTTLPERLFRSQSAVRSILLHHNNISYLPPGIFRNLSRLTTV